MLAIDRRTRMTAVADPGHSRGALLEKIITQAGKLSRSRKAIVFERGHNGSENVSLKEVLVVSN